MIKGSESIYHEERVEEK
jgi:hypothetical protein